MSFSINEEFLVQKNEGWHIVFSERLSKFISHAVGITRMKSVAPQFSSFQLGDT